MNDRRVVSTGFDVTGIARVGADLEYGEAVKRGRSGRTQVPAVIANNAEVAEGTVTSMASIFWNCRLTEETSSCNIQTASV